MEDQTSRQSVDPLFKQILIWMGQSLNFTPQTQVEIGRLPRTIDAVLELPSGADQNRLEQETPFRRLRQHNQIEFKGKADRLHAHNYHFIRGRAEFYMGEKKVAPNDMTVSVICASKPRAILKNEVAVFQPMAQGYYLGDERPPTLLIVVNELPIIPKTIPCSCLPPAKRSSKNFCKQLRQTHGIAFISISPTSPNPT